MMNYPGALEAVSQYLNAQAMQNMAQNIFARQPWTPDVAWDARLAEQDARNLERARHWRRQWQIPSRMGVVE